MVQPRRASPWSGRGDQGARPEHPALSCCLWAGASPDPTIHGPGGLIRGLVGAIPCGRPGCQALLAKKRGAPGWVYGSCNSAGAHGTLLATNIRTKQGREPWLQPRHLKHKRSIGVVSSVHTEPASLRQQKMESAG